MAGNGLDKREGRLRIDFLTSFLAGDPYHMSRSGYEQIVRYIGNSNIFFVKRFRRLAPLILLRRTRIIPWDYTSIEAEIAALKSDGTILHHLYGEDTLWLSLLSRFNKKRCIVATIHRPPRRFADTMPVFWRRTIGNLSGIIVLSPVQLDYFRSFLDSERTLVSLIPHGIDTEYFSPGLDERSPNVALSVGSHLRDQETLIKAMRVVGPRATHLRLVLVSNRGGVLPSNVLARQTLSDSELLHYYRTASFMVLSVKDMTASNALLEAMACGMPVICPRSVAVSFYVGDNQSVTYEPGNYRELADKILMLFQDDRARRRLSSEMRRRAEQFSWPIVCRSIQDFYSQVLESYNHKLDAGL